MPQPGLKRCLDMYSCSPSCNCPHYRLSQRTRVITEIQSQMMCILRLPSNHWQLPFGSIQAPGVFLCELLAIWVGLGCCWHGQNKQIMFQKAVACSIFRIDVDLKCFPFVSGRRDCRIRASCGLFKREAYVLALRGCSKTKSSVVHWYGNISCVITWY